MNKTVGGDRLGSGAGMDVKMRNYSRSTHDLSYLWRSSMSAGTLVPFMSEVGLPGDNFDIDLGCTVLTLPTEGPLFGSYKVQLDVFTCPIRLYNGKLHMNKLGIGMKMDEILLPQMSLQASQEPMSANTPINDNLQINASSIFSYLNIRGMGFSETGTGNVARWFNALPYLSYWDIYKQYYANKQEEEGVVVHVGSGVPISRAIEAATIKWNGIDENILDEIQVIQLDTSSVIKVLLVAGVGTMDYSSVIATVDSTDVFLGNIFTNIDIEGNQATYTGYIDGSFPNGNLDLSIAQQDVGGISVPTIDTPPALTRFPLDNIDVMREDILADVASSSVFLINQFSNAPYGLALDFQNSFASARFNQEGLGIKTYQSDLFNNWISTEWIDGVNGISEVTAVDTTGDSFSIDSLNLAQKVYNMLNRIAISGGTYDDWLDAVYTHERPKSVENPMYEGSLIKELTFEEVISTAGTATQPLGELAGRGRMTGKNKGGKIRVKVNEPCYVMGIVSITPRVDYSQGNKWDMNLKTMNDFHKPALDAIGYQDLITDQMAWFDTKVTGAGADTPVFKSAGKQPAWLNYMTNVNVVRGNFAEQNNSMFMVLNRRYEGLKGSGIQDLTTYIDPSKFNQIFADGRLDAQNFWTQISVGIKARRKMSAKVIPNL